jgi:hypothetical protein
LSEKQKLDHSSVGAWVVTCNLQEVYDVTPDADARLHFFSWRLARTYRTELVNVGDEILLWVGGAKQGGHIPGIWAYGYVVDDVFEGEGVKKWIDEASKHERRPYVPMAMTWLEPPLPKEALQAHKLLSEIEVLRMPRMSNPSYLSPEEADALFELMEKTYSAPVRQRPPSSF